MQERFHTPDLLNRGMPPETKGDIYPNVCFDLRDIGISPVLIVGPISYLISITACRCCRCCCRTGCFRGISGKGLMCVPVSFDDNTRKKCIVKNQIEKRQ